MKIIIGERSLNQHKAKGVLDRTFQYTTYPGDPVSDIKEVMNPQGDPHRQGELDKIIYFRKLMLIYRLIHFNDPIPDVDIGVKRRNKELCKPYIQLFYNTKIQEEIEQTLQTFLDAKNTRKSTSIEYSLLPLINELMSENIVDMSIPEKNVVKSSRIWGKITTALDGQFVNNKLVEFHTADYGTLYKTTITKMICDKFGATSKHTSKGNVLIFDLDKLAKMEKSYNTEIKIKTTLKNVTEDDGEGSEYSEGNMNSDSVSQIDITNPVEQNEYNTSKNLEEKGLDNEKIIDNTITSPDIPLTPVTNNDSTNPTPFIPFTAFTRTLGKQ